MALPRITIVTPSYNQAQYLSETIESILGQGYPNLEYIIIDGGSTDGSVDIIRKWEANLAHWVSEKDRGQSHAINKGLSKGTGDLCNWINSDDILFPGALHQMAKVWMKEPRADLYVGAQAFCDADGRIRRISYPPCRLAVSARHGVIPLGQQSTFFTRNAYDRVGGLREDYHAIMDQDFYCRVLKSGGGGMAVVDLLIGMIRYHTGAKTSCQRKLWVDEKPRFMVYHGISQRQQFGMKGWMRVVRCLDGSYWRSWRLTRKLRGMKPANVTQGCLIG